MILEPIYRGQGVAPAGGADPAAIPAPPPWRRFGTPTPGHDSHGVFQPPDGLVDAVNAALRLRRPLLLTGPPGSGKSSLIESVAAELALGDVLVWSVTSRSTLDEALYRYDVLGRIHAEQVARAAGATAPATEDISAYLQLGPLGTALAPAGRPRALLVDELDKGDLDLAGDLLNVLERGEFEIRELSRKDGLAVEIPGWAGATGARVEHGIVRCVEFPFIVMTSNGDREFPAPFLRRCIRYTMPEPTVESMTDIVRAHLGSVIAADAQTAPLVKSFVDRVMRGDVLAVDQLLNAVYLLAGSDPLAEGERDGLVKLLLRELSRA